MLETRRRKPLSNPLLRMITGTSAVSKDDFPGPRQRRRARTRPYRRHPGTGARRLANRCHCRQPDRAHPIGGSYAGRQT